MKSRSISNHTARSTRIGVGRRFIRVIHAVIGLALPIAAVTADPSAHAADPSHARPSAAAHSTPPTSGRGWRGWLRSRVVSEAAGDQYGLHLDADWRDKPNEFPLVLMVHGFNSTCERNRAVLCDVVEAGYPCGGFCYPNDHTLSESAVLLSRELRSFAKRHPKRRVALVAHSMGGLVARACIENPQLDPGVVDQLVMIATPNHGTDVARAAVGVDVWEHWISRAQGGCWARWRDSVVDGLGEAADDLVPDSPFLAALNARRRNESVQYVLFLGTNAAVDEAEMNWIRDAVRKTGGRIPGVRGAASRVDRWLGDMDELIEGKGDGVVSVESGMLAGVDDVVVLPFGHLSVTSEEGDRATRRVRRELLARLQ